MELTIQEDDSNQRLDRFLRKYFKPYPDIKLTDIFSRIRKGQILVNGKKSKENYRLKVSDKILIQKQENKLSKDPHKLISTKEQKISDLNIQQVKKMIIFEDENRIVRNKPSGVIMHSSGKDKNSLNMNDYLKKYAQSTIPKESNTFNPAFCFRLDKNTSGLVISAKNHDALIYLNNLIKNRKVEKYYQTIVCGKTKDHQIIDQAISKTYNSKFDRSNMEINQQGLQSKTEYRNQNTIKHHILGEISLLLVKLHTGRMHQIRIHLASIGFPVLGDIIYGNSTINRLLYKKTKVNRQLLHSYKYKFFDKFTQKEISFVCKIPLEFNKIINNN